MLFDLLFPKRCVVCKKKNHYFCPQCISEFPLVRTICPMCGRSSIDGVTHAECSKGLGTDGLISVFPYRGGVQDAIKQLKYRFVSDFGEIFIRESLIRVDAKILDFFVRESFLVTPIPLHKLRERWRGFNQAEILGRQFAKALGLKFGRFLERTKNTDALAEIKVRVNGDERREIYKKYVSFTQRVLAEKKLIREKKKKYRKEQMKGAFRYADEAEKVNRVVLVDDVWTSGATMLECAKVLKRNGVGQVWSFTVARSGE